MDFKILGQLYSRDNSHPTSDIGQRAPWTRATRTSGCSRIVFLVLLWLVPPVGVTVDHIEPRTSGQPLTQLSGQYLGRSLEVLSDPQGELQFADVLQRTDGLFWFRGEDPIVNIGFSETPHWFHIAIANDLAVAKNYLLEIGYPLLDHIDVYVLPRGEPATTAQHMRTGDNFPFTDRLIRHPHFVFPQTFAPGAITDIYVRIQTTSSLQVPLSLWRYTEFFERDLLQLVMFGLFIGCIAALILYNFLLYFGVRDIAYLYYAAGLTAYSLVIAVLTGLAYQYLWPSAVWWHDKSLVVLSGISVAFFAQFIKEFLDLRRRYSRIARLFDLYTVVCLGCALAVTVLPYNMMIKVVAVFVALVPMSGYFASIQLWRQGIKSARLFVIAWTLFVFGAMVFVFSKYGLFPRDFTTENAMYIGSVVVVILLSLALADRINAERQEKVTAQQQAITNLQRYRYLYATSLEGLFSASLDGKVLSGNPALARLFGAQTLDELTSKRPQLRQLFTNGDLAWSSLRELLENQGHVRGHEVQGRRLDGDTIWIAVFARLRHVVTDDVIEGSLIDITERKESEGRLSYLAIHDALTGLVNRLEFERRLSDALGRSRSKQLVHATLFIDLDQFKVVNDTCGHVAGDELLRQIALLLRKHVRQRDSLARLGGDEFGILLEDCSPEKAAEIADRLLLDVNEFRFVWKDRTFDLGASIGIVAVTPESESVEEILSLADTACYAAKDAGRNQVVIYSEKEGELQQRKSEMEMVSIVREAIEHDNLTLLYQPIKRISADIGGGEHYEALVRMRGPTGLVRPGAFLPAAERYNLMPRLDRWVVDAALTWLGKSNLMRQIQLLSINLSGRTISDPDFLEFVETALVRHAVRPEQVCFEITESMAIANLRSTLALMERLQRKGIRFSLDDFGSGFSSYSYLKQLPIDFVKIDGSFIRGIATDAIDRAMVESMSDVAHAMDIRVIAEFVESAEIVTELRKLNVDFGQGYYFGRPALMPEVLAEALSR